MSKTLNYLILASGYPGKLIDTIKQRGDTYTLAHPSDFDLFLSDNTNGHDECYLFGSRFPASKYDAVISRIGENREYAAKILRHLKNNLHMFCVQSGPAIETCADKFKSAQIMSENKIKVPKQFYSMKGQYPAFMIKKLGGLPIILKELSGSKGKGLILLESPKQTNMTLESYFKGERKFILQEFLDNGGTDERHIVVGQKVVNSMRRHAPKNDIRANLSLDGTGEAIRCDRETEEICVKAVRSIIDLNFAGVDIMKMKDQEHPEKEIAYFIEINSNPGEKIIEITGHNHYEDLLDWIEVYKRPNHENTPEMKLPAHTPEARKSDPDGDDEAPAQTHEEALAKARKTFELIKNL